MNIFKEKIFKGGDYGNPNQKPVNGRKPAQKTDLWKVQMPQSQLHGKNPTGERA
jgi:hypothetical protein